ncbi:hypothetical protein HELRODRAFT_159193 [Helobdella robusta]|uniref:Uncharacterized protein n=1 Tax=Helobdella robusta TaxID=6412 RepID=T1ENQ4_HELRO|nr:hypothetical protein HELRODRAFT_159193 [Helobdella robusta]ESO12623.1 hypothetical protein HELRODRAFT_159193 [Helobdella robusta]
MNKSIIFCDIISTSFSVLTFLHMHIAKCLNFHNLMITSESRARAATDGQPDNFRKRELRLGHAFKHSSGNCYYIGEVRGFPGSSASLTTCRMKIDGFFIVNNRTYDIHPEPSSKYLAAVREADENHNTLICGLYLKFNAMLSNILTKYFVDH